MVGSSVQVGLNGTEVWAYLVELEDGFRLRLALDDWEATGLCEGRQIPVRLLSKSDACLFVSTVTPLPPIFWITMAKRVRAAG